MAHAQLMIILHVCTLWYEGHWRNILPTYWGLPHFADCLGQGLCLRSQGVFPGLALATLTSPGLHAGCKETDALSSGQQGGTIKGAAVTVFPMA